MEYLAEKNDWVLSTWLSPWIIKDATIRVWLSASLDERARRCSESRGMPLEKAKAFIKEKDELTVKAFQDVYNIDIKNHAFFDMMLNTERLSLEESASIISMLAKGKGKAGSR